MTCDQLAYGIKHELFLMLLQQTSLASVYIFLDSSGISLNFCFFQGSMVAQQVGLLLYSSRARLINI